MRPYESAAAAVNSRTGPDPTKLFHLNQNIKPTVT